MAGDQSPRRSDVASRLRVPPLVGYLLAGIVIGPFTPGIVADLEQAEGE